eukprot:8606573-Pyramimonas_sp.AAC.1
MREHRFTRAERRVSQRLPREHRLTSIAERVSPQNGSLSLGCCAHPCRYRHRRTRIKGWLSRAERLLWRLHADLALHGEGAFSLEGGLGGGLPPSLHFHDAFPLRPSVPCLDLLRPAPSTHIKPTRNTCHI